MANKNLIDGESRVYAVHRNLHFKPGEGYLSRDDFGNLMDTWHALYVGSFSEDFEGVDDIYHLVDSGVTCRHSSGGQVLEDGRSIISLYGKPDNVEEVEKRIMQANEKAKTQPNFLDDLRMEAQDIRDVELGMPEDEEPTG